MALLSIGTCGYSYKDWVGPVASMVRRTPPDFRFTAKLPSAGTHLPELGSRRVHDDVHLLRTNVQPLVEAHRLAAVLAQFPNSFRPNDATRDYLRMLRRALPDLTLAAEFRHREWQTNATLELLRELDIALVLVDQPHFKTLVRESSDVTSDLAYIRFHASRYDYLYTADELAPWLRRILDIAANPNVKEVLAFMNNHPHGKAVRNAEMLADMARTELVPLHESSEKVATTSHRYSE